MQRHKYRPCTNPFSWLFMLISDTSTSCQHSCSQVCLVRTKKDHVQTLFPELCCYRTKWIICIQLDGNTVIVCPLLLLCVVRCCLCRMAIGQSSSQVVVVYMHIHVGCQATISLINVLTNQNAFTCLASKHYPVNCRKVHPVGREPARRLLFLCPAFW